MKEARPEWGKRLQGGQPCRDKGQAQRTPTHNDWDRTPDPFPYSLYSTCCTQNQPAATHPKPAKATQQDMGTGPDPQINQTGGGNRGVSVTRIRILRNRKSAPGSPLNPHLAPPEASGRMCQASRGGARKRLEPAHSAVPGAPPLVKPHSTPTWCSVRRDWFLPCPDRGWAEA